MTGWQSRASRLRPGLAGALLLALAGCATATIEDAVPVSATTGFPEGAIDTDVYPDLNVRPEVAAPQISEGERAAKSDELLAARTRAQSTASQSPAQAAATRSELETRKRRGDEVLQEIEGETATQ